MRHYDQREETMTSAASSVGGWRLRVDVRAPFDAGDFFFVFVVACRGVGLFLCVSQASSKF